MPNSLPSNHANVAAHNVYTIPSYGKAISLDDQGVYYTLNHQTGQIHSVFQLVYADDWYLYRLQKTAVEDTDEGHQLSWNLMAASADYALESMDSEQINYYFSRPEYAEPRGAWQVIRNSQYGFAKFTPNNANADLKYALLVFQDRQMQMPVLIHKLEEQAQLAEESLVSLA